jgi:threonine dehydratase
MPERPLKAAPATPTAEDWVARAREAAGRVYDVAVRTPLEPAGRLSARTGNRVLLKREDLQPVFSFKLRGAYNKIASLAPDALTAGVICSSAGNHAQGVALAARRLGIRAVVVMPATTPRIKVEAVRELGAEIELHGDNYDAAQARAKTLAAEHGYRFIHPFDDPDVIAGQATIGMEIDEQQAGPIDCVFVPIGGGGLAAGVAGYLKAVRPEVRIVGIEPDESASMQRAFESGGPVTLDSVGIFADGVAVRRAGDLTYEVCRRHVDEIMTVTTDQTCAAIRDIFEDTRTVVEPAGALAIAGMKAWLAANDVRDKTAVAIVCGANLNFDRLRHIAERAAVGERREALLAVEIDERPGSFRAFCRALGRRNVTEFNYRYRDSGRAQIFVGVELSGGPHQREALIDELRGGGYAVVDISDNEVAALHIRHLVGGCAPGLADERLFRFEFPERPGALAAFLDAVGSDWNISLFHYRNHGSDYGRVLAGIQVPAAERDELEAHLQTLGYAHWDESDNPAYRLFLT